jgi:hypothetical protein
MPNPITDHYEINVAANGSHYCRIHLPVGLDVQEALARLNLFERSLNVDPEQPLFELTLYEKHAASFHQVG